MRIGTILLAILFTNILFPAYAQDILIKNEENGRPVSDVFVYSKNKKHTSYSDQKGMANLEDFENGIIHLQHPSFEEAFVQYEGISLTIELKEKIISYDEVVISATKWEQEEDAISQQILSVDKKSISFENSQTSADLLNATGQVFVQKSQLGGGSPKIRGFAANAVLLVVDGVRMNNAIFRGGNLQNVINIDPNALESSEVIFGPGSVIYGSDALGGVMNFRTSTPQWSSDEITDFSANSLFRYSSVANEKTGHLDVAVSKKRFTFFHSTTFSDFEDLRAGANRSGNYVGEFERRFFVQRIEGEDVLVNNNDVNKQRFSGYNLFNTISKASFRVGSNADLTYGFYLSSTSDIPRYDNLTETIGSTDSLENAEWYYGPQKWMMHSLRLNIYQSNSLFDQGRLTIAYQEFEESRHDRKFGSDSLRVRSEGVKMYSASLDFDKEIRQSNLYYGVDFYFNDITSAAFRRNIVNGGIGSAETRYPDGGSSFTSLAAYGSLVSPLTQRLTLNAGVRINAIQLEGNTNNPRAFERNAAQINLQNTAVNGALGLVYNRNKKNKFSYNASTGFRAPNVDDVGKVFEVGNRLSIPNPDLRPEYTISNEVAYQYKSERLYLKAVGFYSRLFDAILEGPFTLDGAQDVVVGNDTLTVSAKVNTGKAVVYGGSIFFTAEIAKRWAFTKTISYTGGKDIDNDEPLRHTTPIFGRTALTFQDKGWRSSFYVEYNSNRGRDQIPDSEIVDKPYLYTDYGSPGWYTLNVRASYAFYKHFTIDAGVENILDTHYRPYTSGISAPGRNFVLALRASL